MDIKIHLAVDAHNMPFRVVLIEGSRVDCTQAAILIEGVDARYLLADPSYDGDAIVQQAIDQGM